MQHGQFQIRLAVESDIDAIVPVYREQLKFQLQFDPTYQLSWAGSEASKQRFLHHINDKDCFLGVAADRETIIGYLMGRIDPGHPASTKQRVAELKSFHVLENFRSNGVGRELATKFFDFCRASNAERIKLEVSAGNFRAQEFYQTIGFENYALIFSREL